MLRGHGVRSVVEECRSLCKQRGSKPYARNMEKYFKGVLPMHGLKANQIKKIYQDVAISSSLADWSVDKMFDAGMKLLSSQYFEEKGVGIWFLKSRIPELTKDHVEHLAETFDSYVIDWATCDGLSTGVLRPMILADSSIISCMISWSSCENLWRRRASCVAFVGLAKKGNHNDVIETICQNSVQMSERFVQLGVGWLLRELSLADRPRVIAFLKTHSSDISREGLRYALEKMPKTLRKELMDYHKEQNKKAKPS